jgi:hypothetical protein
MPARRTTRKTNQSGNFAKAAPVSPPLKWVRVDTAPPTRPQSTVRIAPQRSELFTDAGAEADGAQRQPFTAPHNEEERHDAQPGEGFLPDRGREAELGIEKRDGPADDQDSKERNEQANPGGGWRLRPGCGGRIHRIIVRCLKPKTRFKIIFCGVSAAGDQADSID